MMHRWAIPCFSGLLALCLHAGAAQFSGMAPIGSGGIEPARAAAISDALQNASLAAGATVRGTSDSQTGGYSEQTSVQGAPVGDYQLLKEWQSDGFWHVILDVRPAMASASGTALPSACGFDRYRRKVLLTHFYVQQPSQTTDLLRVPEGMQAYLARQLRDTGHYLPQQAAYQAAFQFSPRFIEPQQLPERVHELAQRYGTQFVVGGIVRDAGSSGQRLKLGLGSDVREGESKQILNVPGARFTQLGVKTTPTDRRFDVEVFVYDGISGAMLARQMYAGQASGEVLQREGTEFGSPRFFATDYGRMVQEQLQKVGQLLDEAVACLPMTARVVRVEGRQVYFDAGAEVGIRPGDRLQVYRLQPDTLPLQSVAAPQGSTLGMPEKRTGKLKVTAVQPLFSTGTVEGVVAPGDYVRIEVKETAQ